MAEANPFDQFDTAAPSTDGTANPFDQFDHDPGGTSDLLHGAERGALDIPNMAAKTGQYIGHATHALGAAVDSDTLEDLGSAIAARAGSMADSTQGGAATAQSAPGQVGGLIRRNVYGVGEGLGQMGTVAAAGAATGAALGSIVPGAGTLVGAGVGASIAMLAALPALFAGSTAESTFEKVQANQEKAGPPTQANENTALGAGAVTGTIAGVGQAVLSKIGVGKMLQPVLDKVGSAAEGTIVQSALQSTLGSTAKGIGAAAVEGGAVNAAQQAGIQGAEAQYGVGTGPTVEGAVDAFAQGAGITAITHAGSSVVQNARVSNTVKLLADPSADPNDRANAALGAAAVIATKSPDVAQDFGLYAQQQILNGQPIEIAPDAFYSGIASQIKQQQTDAAAQANRATSGDFPNFIPTGDEVAGNAPSYVTDPNVPAPTAAAPLGLLDENGRVTAAQVPNFIPTGDEAAAFAPAHVTAPSLTDTIGGIMSAGSVDEAIAAAEKSIVSPRGPQIEPIDSNASLARPSLIADQQFYGDQAEQAQAALRTNAFLQGEGTPPVPTDAFAQRQAQINEQIDQARTAAFDQAQREQLTQQADQAPAVTEAQGFDESAAPTQLSGAMSAEIQRLGNRNLNNLTTTQLAMVAMHHPDEAIQQQATEIAQNRRNGQILTDAKSARDDVAQQADAASNEGMNYAPSTERAAVASDEAQTTQPASEVTPAVPVPHTALADTAPELMPLKAAIDSDAKARGSVNSDTGFQPVNLESLPKQRVPTENGVAGATTLSRDDANLLQKSAGIFGKKVVLFRQDGDVAGKSLDGAILPHDPSTIYVNADASGAHHLVVVGHELAHQMQAEAPNLYKGMQDALMAHAKDGSLGDFAKYYGNDPNAEIGDEATKQRMTDEFIADLVGNRSGEYKTWQQIFTSMAGSENKSLVYRVADFIRQFIGKLLGNEKFKGFATDDMVNNLNDVRSTIRRALGEYAVQANAKPMQHEADQLRATAENKRAGTMPKLVEPVKAEPRADTGIPVSKAAPAPVASREPEPTQASKLIEPSGTPRTARALESPERATVSESKQGVNDERASVESPASSGAGKDLPAGSPLAESVSRSGVIRGSTEWLAKQSRTHQGDDLAGLPTKVTIPGVGPVEFHSFKPAQDSARSYAEKHGLSYDPPKTYAKVDPERATRIAQAFDAMQHDPHDPVVEAAYRAMIDETRAQYAQMLKDGIKVEFIKPGQDDPYAASPRLAQLDVANNNHMWIYSTKEGFGSSDFDTRDNPLLEDTGVELDGQPVLANDMFRAVHDYYGHVANGVGFRADGEENAWRSHIAMYSDLARRAATTETRGQNSWVNYGPYAEINRTASGADTHFADQKIGLLPEWASEEGRTDDAVGEQASANPLSDNPQIRASGERALYLGKLDVAQEAAARAIGGITTKQSYKQQIEEYRKDLGLRLRQGIADQFAPIKAVDEEAYKQTRLSKGAATGGLEAMMLYGKPELRDGVLDVNVHDKGMAATLSDLDGEHGRFFLWVAAQRAEQLKAQGKENLFSNSDISALKTLDQNDATHPQRQAKFAKALTEYNDMNDAVLKVAEQSGILDPASRALFKNQPYVPFYRVMDDGEGMTGPGKSAGLVNQYAFKKLKGGTNQLNQDLLANTMQNWAHLLDASAKNRAAQLTMNAAEKLGVADKVPAAQAGKGTIRVKVNGKDEHWEVNDPHLLTAISAMSAQVPNWMKPLALFKRILTTGTTLAPGFRIRNLIRDTLTVLGTSDIRLNAAANIAQGWKSQAHDSQTHASMLASGGIINFGSMLEGNEAARAHRLIQMGVDKATILNSQGALDAMWQKARQAAEVYHEIGNKVENANRGALFEQKLAKGASFSDAAYAARDLMDFSLQGANPVVRFLTTAVPFLNARIQGAYKLGRAIGDNPQRAATVMGAVAMASLALMLKYKDDPDFKNRPDWDRDNYWWFKIGDTAYRIPKPFEVGAIGTLAERSWERMTDPEMTNARYVGEIRDVLFNQFNLNPTPQIVRPLLNVYANKDDFTGNQIESTSQQQLQPEDRYSPYTSMTSRFLGSLGLPDPIQLMLGRYSKLSPVQMDSLVNGYFGWLGTSALTAADSVVRPLSGVGEKPARTLKDMTLGFAESLPANASRYSDTMYENLNAINQAYASYHAALKSGQFDKAKDILATEHLLGPSNKTLIQEHEMATHMADAESKLALQERRVLDSTSLSSDTKRAMLTRINQQRSRIAEAASDAELRHRLSQ